MDRSAARRPPPAGDRCVRLASVALLPGGVGYEADAVVLPSLGEKATEDALVSRKKAQPRLGAIAHNPFVENGVLMLRWHSEHQSGIPVDRMLCNFSLVTLPVRGGSQAARTRGGGAHTSVGVGRRIGEVTSAQLHQDGLPLLLGEAVERGNERCTVEGDALHAVLGGDGPRSFMQCHHPE